MNKEQAIEHLTKVLPFEGEACDYESTFDGKTISNMEELLHILENEYGEVFLNAINPISGEMAILTISLTDSEISYTTVAPHKEVFELMEAAYALIP